MQGCGASVCTWREDKFLRILCGGCAVILAILGLLVGPARAGEVPLQADAFTTYMQAQFQKSVPTATFKILGPLSLDVKAPAGDSTTNLQTLYSNCLRKRDECDGIVAQFVSDMSARYRTPDAPLKASQILIVVRPSAYVQEIRRNLGDFADPVAAALVGDLWIIAAKDEPTTIGYINTKNLAPLGLSPEEALVLGKKNMKKSMRKALSFRGKLRPDVIRNLMGSPYESSLLAFPELWARIAKKLNGHLIVTVPAKDVVLFTDDNKPDAVSVLAATTRPVLDGAERPFSADVYRWSPMGWIPVPPAGKQ